MIPYIVSETYSIFGVTLHTWGTFVAFGYVIGTYVAWWRAKEKHLDPDRVLDLAFWIFLVAMIGARAFHVAFYEPRYYLLHPLEAIDPRRPGFAMFGGLIGAATAFAWMMRGRAHEWIAYADTLVWGLPWGCGIGRIGCFLIHDHPGTLTHFLLGVKYPDGRIRHDLGLYLSIIGLATGIGFVLLNRRVRRSGFWLGAWMIVEGVTRFGLDFLRVTDANYFGLTPTQYASVPLFVVGVWVMFLQKKNDQIGR